MKQRLLTLFAAVLMTSCAGTDIVHTDYASGAAHPKAIYIRPFGIKYAKFIGNHGTEAEREIRKSLAPAEMADILQEYLCKLAPSMVIKDCDVPKSGWLVEGEFELVDAGMTNTIRHNRGSSDFSKVRMHVRIIGVGEAGNQSSAKDSEKVTATKNGRLLYEFDVAAGSWSSIGSVYSPGIGYAPPFDYRNASERILMELTTDPHRFGNHGSTTIRD